MNLKLLLEKSGSVSYVVELKKDLQKFNYQTKFVPYVKFPLVTRFQIDEKLRQAQRRRDKYIKNIQQRGCKEYLKVLTVYEKNCMQEEDRIASQKLRLRTKLRAAELRKNSLLRDRRLTLIEHNQNVLRKRYLHSIKLQSKLQMKFRLLQAKIVSSRAKRQALIAKRVSKILSHFNHFYLVRARGRRYETDRRVYYYTVMFENQQIAKGNRDHYLKSRINRARELGANAREKVNMRLAEIATNRLIKIMNDRAKFESGLKRKKEYLKLKAQKAHLHNAKVENIQIKRSLDNWFNKQKIENDMQKHSIRRNQVITSKIRQAAKETEKMAMANFRRFVANDLERTRV
eukprot:TRINITY_DN3303_c0_g9_i1.p1 TRINITY_DN3303_c0_g9~~TRINITY_DN3303_c0_g9_i1.p1  ORF type:complete len:345 (-),score=80.98 TRINITY_DN3303_c0_g9_i1:126-1160(-)